MTDPLSHCEALRKETLSIVQAAGPCLDSIIAQGKYFSLVDDQTTTNNYADLVRSVTKNCKKLVNPRLWVFINAFTNPNKLVEQLELDWPKKAEQDFAHLKDFFGEVEQDFQAKGVRPSRVPGVNTYDHDKDKTMAPRAPPRQQSAISNSIHTAQEEHNPILDDERLKNIDRKIAERILSEVVDKKQSTTWNDIAGLENVKQAVNEIVVYPMQNPDLFKGLLAPAKGLLLFGPPGTGKTLIGKCIACESGATFFSISASTLTSKWVGEGEKSVRALFAVARCMQPSVVFIDEIDSLLTRRVDGEHDSSRRMKTEFLVQFDGITTGADDRLLVVGATNRPQELDEAARRRFTKRIYVPLPDELARRQIVRTLMAKIKSDLSDSCLNSITQKTDGFSGADMAELCKAAAMCSIRDVIRSRGNAKNIACDEVPPVRMKDFEAAFRTTKASVSDADLGSYEEWDSKYGEGCSVESTQFM